MSSPEIYDDEGSPVTKKQKIESTDNAVAGPSRTSEKDSSSLSLSSHDLPDGFKTVSSIMKDNASSQRSEFETRNYDDISLGSLPDSILAGISTPSLLQNNSKVDSIYDGIRQDDFDQATDKSQVISPGFAKPFFPNDHFDDISHTQLLKIENDAVKGTRSSRTSFVQPSSELRSQFPSTMWARKSLTLKRSLISAIREVEAITDHIKQLTKELQESNSLTSN